MTTLVLPIELEPGTDMFEQIRHMSDDEFYYFCQDNANLNFERDANGNIKPMGQTGADTGEKNSELGADLVIWNRQSKLGFVYDSSTAFRLPNSAVRSPDVAWLTAERRNAFTPEQRRKFLPLCPDFVVELVSESDLQKDTEAKMVEYMANGCRLGWLINPKTQTAKVYRANGSIDVITSFAGALSGEGVLPGFSLSLALLC
ncbi:Uma2 family endonuclease [Fibrella aquatilis]|uniref:Uma2 family endonuclease n=1 Tax=Fibrella aquatilis TaxID=2817059 RepID=A0A939G5H0_9BACT|nr:Uma2 family endonuclease [Fibrella aquatilis]MBO0930989.1 Uma2 family endonuclease [Fibrella aquatilis]